MNGSQRDVSDPGDSIDEPQGPEQYLHPGEELRIYSSDVQIKKFRFEAYLTNRRLFLIDQTDRKPGVTAKEIPVEFILGSYLEDSPTREPVIVLSVKTADDDIRTMKMIFAHTGEERTTEAEEWIHLLAKAPPFRDEPAGRPRSAAPSGPAPALSPEARSLSDTIVVPSPRPQPPVRKEEQVPVEIDLKPPRDEMRPSRGEIKPVRDEMKPDRDEMRPVLDEMKPPRVEKVSQKEERAVVKKPPQPAPPVQREVQSGAVTTPIQYCFHCGKKLPANANFCPYCGTNVQQNAHHEEYSHLPLPLHQFKEEAPQPAEEKKKGRFGRFFGR